MALIPTSHWNHLIKLLDVCDLRSSSNKDYLPEQGKRKCRLFLVSVYIRFNDLHFCIESPTLVQSRASIYNFHQVDQCSIDSFHWRSKGMTKWNSCLDLTCILGTCASDKLKNRQSETWDGEWVCKAWYLECSTGTWRQSWVESVTQAGVRTELSLWNEFGIVAWESTTRWDSKTG